MLAPTMALLTRSFRLDARSRRAHLVRFVFVLFILVTTAFSHMMGALFGAPGLNVLISIAWLNFVLILLAGIGYLSTAISEEKDEGTLGLLKMAGASPLALLLGKSTTRLVSVLLVLAVQFPFVLLATTLGGVTMHQVVAVFVALAAFLVFVANLGLFCSVISRNSRWAERMMTILVVCGVILGPMLLNQVALLTQNTLGDRWPGLAPLVDTIGFWTTEVPVYQRINVILSTGFSEPSLSTQVIADLVCGMLLFGLSWILFERFTRETHALKPLEAIFIEPLRRKRRTTKNRTWKHALAWKDFYFLSGGRTLIVFQIVMYLIFVPIFAPFTQDLMPGEGFTRQNLGTVAMWMPMIVGAILLSLFASRVFREEIQAHTLPLLMILPDSTARIALSKAAAALPALAPTFGCFLLGAVIYPEGFLEFLTGILSVGVWYGISFFVCFLSLTAYLSLIVKWGSLPLALFLSYMSQCCLSPLYFVIGSAVQFQSIDAITFLMQFIPAVTFLVLSVFLQVGICKKLESLAAE